MPPCTWLVHRSSSGLGLAALAGALVLGAAGGCGGKASPPSFDVHPPHDTAETIPETPVTGTLLEEAFTASDARFFIDRRMGYEKLTIYLTAGKASQACEHVEPDKAPSIWLRRKGGGGAKPGEHRLVAGEPSEWEIHYQMLDHHDQWVGNGDASALLVFAPQTHKTNIVGSLSVCFADGRKSCVSGSFSADRCVINIDAVVRGGEPEEKPVASMLVPDIPPPAAGGAGGAGTTDPGKGEGR